MFPFQSLTQWYETGTHANRYWTDLKVIMCVLATQHITYKSEKAYKSKLTVHIGLRSWSIICFVAMAIINCCKS